MKFDISISNSYFFLKRIKSAKTKEKVKIGKKINLAFCGGG